MFVMTFLTIFTETVTDVLCSFRLVLEEKTGKEIPESSSLECLETFSANNLESIADLPWLKILLAISPKSQEPSFLEVIDSIVLLAYTSLELQEPLCSDY